MFPIDLTDPTPLYAQLERAIRVAIASGRLGLGEKLPTVRQLAVDLRVNANTVAKVYGELEHAGVLETRRGVGTFVRAPASDAVSDGERERQFSDLADRFVADSAALGINAAEAVDRLRLRIQRGEKSDA